jgi:hypothetical protein
VGLRRRRRGGRLRSGGGRAVGLGAKLSQLAEKLLNGVPGTVVDEKVDLIDNKTNKKPEDNVNYRIWVIQVTIWVIIVTLSKIVVFFFEVVYYRPIVSFGEDAL